MKFPISIEVLLKEAFFASMLLLFATTSAGAKAELQDSLSHKAYVEALLSQNHEIETEAPQVKWPTSELDRLLRALRSLYAQHPGLGLKGCQLLQRFAPDSSEHVVHALGLQGLIYRDWGDFGESLNYLFEALELAEAHFLDEQIYYMVVLNIAAVYSIRGENKRAIAMLEETRQRAAAQADGWVMASINKDLGGMKVEEGEYEQAERYLHEGLAFAQEHQEKWIASVCLANLALLYTNTDQPEKSMRAHAEALAGFKELGHYQMMSAMYMDLGQMHIKNKEMALAKQALDSGFTYARYLNSHYDLNSGYRRMIEWHRQLGQYNEAMAYHDSLLELQAQLFNEERARQAEQWEVRYETRRTERELSMQKKLNVSLQEANAAQENQNRAILAALILLLGVFFLGYNRYRLKERLMKEREKLMSVEKRELELDLAKSRLEAAHELVAKELKEAENLRLKQKNEQEAEIFRLQEVRLKEELSFRERELATIALNMVQKSDLITKVADRLQVVEKNGADNQQMLALKKELTSQWDQENDWHEFKLHFERVHPAFFQNLLKAHPNLTQHEQRHCSYMRMRMETKEIARLMGISPSSVQVARHRLKKKLGLSADDSLPHFIAEL